MDGFSEGGGLSVVAMWRIIDRARRASGRRKRNAALLGVTVGGGWAPGAGGLPPSTAMVVLSTKAWSAGGPQRSGDGP